MTINIENRCDCKLDLDYEEIITQVVQSAVEKENFPFTIELNVILTDNNDIQELNKEFRNIEQPTDVLSFPQIEYEGPGDFSHIQDNLFYYANPGTGDIILGDIVISLEKVDEQAREYGHSTRREFAFLVAHSMLHLFGYDHMEPDEDTLMQERQELILQHIAVK